MFPSFSAIGWAIPSAGSGRWRPRAIFSLSCTNRPYSAIFGMMLAHEEKDTWSTPPLFWWLLGAGLVGGLILGRLIARKPPPPAKPALKIKARRR